MTETPYTDNPVCTEEAARAAGLDVALSPSELTSCAESIVSARGGEPAPEVDLARAVPLMADEIGRLRKESGDYADTCAKWQALFDEVAAERDNLRAELAARPTKAQVLREAAPELDAICEEHGVLGVGSRMRRLADAAERGERR